MTRARVLGDFNNDFTADVDITLTGLPGGVTATATSAASGAPGVVQIVVAADAAPTGQTMATVRGVSGDAVETLPLWITVVDALEPGDLDPTYGFGEVLRGRYVSPARRSRRPSRSW